mmetsp:Transcript_8083/g.24559  ORF Transcript_8083/g.24559 Transcript_8083/m.24559 type:complete len:309 (+) Transcript_8083:528-1454(+)
MRPARRERPHPQLDAASQVRRPAAVAAVSWRCRAPAGAASAPRASGSTPWSGRCRPSASPPMQRWRTRLPGRPCPRLPSPPGGLVRSCSTGPSGGCRWRSSRPPTSSREPLAATLASCRRRAKRGPQPQLRAAGRPEKAWCCRTQVAAACHGRLATTLRTWRRSSLPWAFTCRSRPSSWAHSASTTRPLSRCLGGAVWPCGHCRRRGAGGERRRGSGRRLPRAARASFCTSCLLKGVHRAHKLETAHQLTGAPEALHRQWQRTPARGRPCPPPYQSSGPLTSALPSWRACCCTRSPRSRSCSGARSRP